jgi:hypothetical protein
MAASTEIAQAFASFKLGKVAFSGTRPLGLSCTRYVTSCVRGETMRCMDATEVAPAARRAVVSVGGPFHRTERARNAKKKKRTTAGMR